MSDELRMLLSCETFLKELVVYLESTSSQENALCYGAVRRYFALYNRTPPTPVTDILHPMVQDARTIYKTYFKETAVLKANVTAQIVQPLDRVFLVC